MADVSKINLDGEVLTVKDSSARSDVAKMNETLSDTQKTVDLLSANGIKASYDSTSETISITKIINN